MYFLNLLFFLIFTKNHLPIYIMTTAAVGVFAAFNKESVKDRLLLEPGEKVGGILQNICKYVTYHMSHI